MSNAPYMPFFVADYLADTGHLTTIEHGAYLLLIMHYWRVGCLPTDDRKLATICRVSGHQWRAIRGTISGFFTENWRHGRVEIEIANYKRKCEVRTKCGAMGGNAKALKNIDSGLAKANILLDISYQQKASKPLPSSSDVRGVEETSVPSTPSEAGASVVRLKKIKPSFEYPENFERFWSGFPTDANMSKKQTFAEWEKLSAEDRDKAILSCRPFRTYCSARPDYRPVHANRYLAQGRFEGHAAVSVQTSKTVFVSLGTPQWAAWEIEYRRTRHQSPPVNKQGTGWHFPSEYPAGNDEERMA